ncbi:MAG: hypothetical protein HFH29_13530, partial [Eubacterium sp.]|nr:hypothetical protein [Eubacterium sp.]
LREELKSIEVGLFIYNIETYKKRLEEIIKDEEIKSKIWVKKRKKLDIIMNIKRMTHKFMVKITKNEMGG